MKLNPLESVFNVSVRKFLGSMVAIMGIGANPAQIKALLEFKSPTSRKKVQKLFRALSILGRFIFQYIDRL